ncbi:MAG: hypothetical protein L0Y72_23320 [Gemmataceae bacterium]|nr:hypothetical protein [Gemmataceae bacterium]MCI0741974.1 hypothetical protein [Gemmataceae bacterium]
MRRVYWLYAALGLAGAALLTFQESAHSPETSVDDQLAEWVAESMAEDDEETLRVDQRIADLRKFQKILRETTDHLEKNAIHLADAAKRIAEAAGAFSPEYLRGVEALEQGATQVECVALNLVRHFLQETGRNVTGLTHRLQQELKALQQIVVH